MERKTKIELLKSLKDGTRPAKEVIELLAGQRIEVDNFMDMLMITSRPENMEGKEIIATGELLKFFENLEPQENNF